MVDVGDSFASTLAREGWGLYGLGMAVLLLRLYGRARRLGGVFYYQADDYLEMLAAFFYTVLIITLNMIVDKGGSNLFTTEQFSTFTPADIEARVAGSKIVLVSEQAMLNVIYVLKACVLVLYTRLTLGLTAQRFVRCLAVYVAVGWTATQITMFTACRPFSGYWAVPPPDPQCATLERYAIVQGCFNITSDVLMLLVPLPLVSRMHIAWRQKAVLIFIFSLGICVIVAALLTKIFNLRNPYSPVYMLWYIREATVATCVSNLPLVWPLLREWFPWLRSLSAPGVLPTPHSVRRTKAVSGSTWDAMTQRGGSQLTGAAMAATGRRDTLDEFRHWLNAADLELQRPPSCVRSPSSQRSTLSGRADEPEGLPGGKSRKQHPSSLPDPFLQGWDGAEPSLRKQTTDLDLERGVLYSCFGPGQGLYPEPKKPDASATK